MDAFRHSNAGLHGTPPSVASDSPARLAGPGNGASVHERLNVLRVSPEDSDAVPAPKSTASKFPINSSGSPGVHCSGERRRAAC